MLSSQMRRSAVYRFFQIAMGSAFELEIQMAIAHRCGLIGGNAQRELDDSLNRVKAKLIRLMQSLGVDRWAAGVDSTMAQRDEASRGRGGFVNENGVLHPWGGLGGYPITPRVLNVPWA